MFKLIFWATDGSEHADRALEYARQLAEASSAELVAAHVREFSAGRSPGYPVHVDEGEIETKIEAQANELKDSGINVRLERLEGTAGGAAHAIADLAAADGADLIVVGTRGHGHVTGLLLGGVTQRLLHISKCPVLAVPPAP
jgi:nucleotide-binding universal stress UspA family protein